MALTRSDLSELLVAFRAGDGVVLIGESVRLVLQESIEIELPETIGVGRFERIESRTGEHDGSRSRSSTTQAGDVETRDPETPHRQSVESTLEPHRRIDQTLAAVVMEATSLEVSTRSVDDLVAASGIDSGISRSEVSRIYSGLDEVVGAFRTRQLVHIEFPDVHLDATDLHVRNHARRCPRWRSWSHRQHRRRGGDPPSLHGSMSVTPTRRSTGSGLRGRQAGQVCAVGDSP